MEAKLLRVCMDRWGPVKGKCIGLSQETTQRANLQCRLELNPLRSLPREEVRYAVLLVRVRGVSPGLQVIPYRPDSLPLGCPPLGDDAFGSKGVQRLVERKTEEAGGGRCSDVVEQEYPSEMLYYRKVLCYRRVVVEDPKVVEGIGWGHWDCWFHQDEEERTNVVDRQNY